MILASAFFSKVLRKKWCRSNPICWWSVLFSQKKIHDEIFVMFLGWAWCRCRRVWKKLQQQLPQQFFTCSPNMSNVQLKKQLSYGSNTSTMHPAAWRLKADLISICAIYGKRVFKTSISSNVESYGSHPNCRFTSLQSLHSCFGHVPWPENNPKYLHWYTSGSCIPFR